MGDLAYTGEDHPSPPLPTGVDRQVNPLTLIKWHLIKNEAPPTGRGLLVRNGSGIAICYLEKGRWIRLPRYLDHEHQFYNVEAWAPLPGGPWEGEATAEDMDTLVVEAFDRRFIVDEKIPDWLNRVNQMVEKAE